MNYEHLLLVMLCDSSLRCLVQAPLLTHTLPITRARRRSSPWIRLSTRCLGGPDLTSCCAQLTGASAIRLDSGGCIVSLWSSVCLVTRFYCPLQYRVGQGVIKEEYDRIYPNVISLPHYKGHPAFGNSYQREDVRMPLRALSGINPTSRCLQATVRLYQHHKRMHRRLAMELRPMRPS